MELSNYVKLGVSSTQIQNETRLERGKRQTLFGHERLLLISLKSQVTTLDAAVSFFVGRATPVVRFGFNAQLEMTNHEY